MIGRQSLLSITVAAVIATAAHWAGASLLAQWLLGQPASPRRNLMKHLEVILPVPQKIKLGRDAPQSSAVAWIPYDSFRELIAPQSKTRQPALQQQVDPVPNAPMPLDPSPPALSPIAADDGAMLASAADSPTVSEAAGGFPLDSADIQIAQRRHHSASPGSDGQIHRKKVATRQPAETSMVQSEQSSPRRPNPTAAPRADRESSPSRLQTESATVIPGGVLVGQGIEIKTVRPRLSMVTWLSTVPNNPVARVVFDPHDGRVIDATLTKTSGYPAVDGQLVASLYRWRAEGKRLQQRTRPFEVRIELILTGR